MLREDQSWWKVGSSFQLINVTNFIHGTKTDKLCSVRRTGKTFGVHFSLILVHLPLKLDQFALANTREVSIYWTHTCDPGSSTHLRKNLYISRCYTSDYRLTNQYWRNSTPKHASGIPYSLHLHPLRSIPSYLVLAFPHEPVVLTVGSSCVPLLLILIKYASDAHALLPLFISLIFPTFTSKQLKRSFWHCKQLSIYKNGE